MGAELGISRFRASADMSLGQTLVSKLPMVAERFLAGDLDLRVVAAIDCRTALVGDPGILSQLDETLARMASEWNALSRNKLDNVIDWLVVELDPEARRVARERQDDRCVNVRPDRHGMSEVSGRLPAADGATLDKRLELMADAVCRDDPRTRAQRRADALVALADGSGALACQCGVEGCPVASSPSPSAQVVVHVIAEPSTITGDCDKSGYVPGQGPIPAAAVQGLIASGRAKVRHLRMPQELRAERGYRPSRALSDFLLCRHLTCCFPGCDAPAERCDTDHTIPWPDGPTHPSNNKPYCRHHHLLKTFWSGPGGWNDTQHPDGSITFTSPSGRHYVTKPLGTLFFPQLSASTGIVAPTGDPPLTDGPKTLKMPHRRRTRRQDRAARIIWERGVNRAIIEANPPPF